MREPTVSQVPGLAMIIVGERKDSQTYVRMKRKSCSEVGIESYERAMPAESSQEEVLAAVREFNDDPKVHGRHAPPSYTCHVTHRTCISATTASSPPSFLQSAKTYSPFRTSLQASLCSFLCHLTSMRRWC